MGDESTCGFIEYLVKWRLYFVIMYVNVSVLLTFNLRQLCGNYKTTFYKTNFEVNLNSRFGMFSKQGLIIPTPPHPLPQHYLTEMQNHFWEIYVSFTIITCILSTFIGLQFQVDITNILHLDFGNLQF